MKKLVAILFSMSFVVGSLAGCGQAAKGPETSVPETGQTETGQTETSGSETEADAGAAKTGLAVITTLGSSAPAGEKDGLAQTDSMVVAVLVGEDEKILACNIDAAQTKVNFSADGKLVTDLGSTIKSKQELGAEYGMEKASAIGKEWNEQADAFAAYVVGKTIDDVKGIAVNEEGYPSGDDLTSSVTVNIGGFIAAVEKAVLNAQDMGANSTDSLGLAVSTKISGSKEATAEEAGLAEAYSTYAVVTKDSSGKITGSYIDMTQGKVNFDTKGVITSDLTVETQTKQELGDAYGMKKASSIGKEWFEQANAFSDYVKGKNIEEIKGIAVDEAGLAADADLVSSVTLKAGPFIEILEKAEANAK